MPKLWPDVPAISDPERRLYAGMGLKRAGFWKLLRPRAFAHLIRALLKGHGVGRPRGGDVLQMPGAFLFVGGEIVWSHEFAGGAGDHPDWGAVAKLSRPDDAPSDP